MSLQKQEKKAFMEGSEWSREYRECFGEFPSRTEIDKAFMDYYNGNNESVESSAILDES